MSSFFTTNSNNGSGIEVSSQFWIFWCVVGPMTVVIVGSWVLWMNRREVIAYLGIWTAKKRARDEEDGLSQTAGNAIAEDDGASTKPTVRFRELRQERILRD